MKIIRVSAVLIISDDKVLAAERDYGEWKDTRNSWAASRKKGRPERKLPSRRFGKSWVRISQFIPVSAL